MFFEPDKKFSTAILHIHGMGENFYENTFLDSMAEGYTKAGYAFLTGNNRGHDFVADFQIVGPRERHKRIGDAFEQIEDCVFDIDAWLNFLKRKGYKRFILQGHSLGAVKAVYYLSHKKKNSFGALVLASPPDMLGLVRIKTEKDNFARDLKEARKLVKQNKNDIWLENKVWNLYYKSAKSYVNFFADNAKTDVFPILRNGDFKELKSIKIPILAFYGGTDDAAVFSPEKDLGIIKKHLKNEKSKTLLIGAAPHSYFKHEKQTASAVVSWLKKVF